MRNFLDWYDFVVWYYKNKNFVSDKGKKVTNRNIAGLAYILMNEAEISTMNGMPSKSIQDLIRELFECGFEGSENWMARIMNTCY